MSGQIPGYDEIQEAARAVRAHFGLAEDASLARVGVVLGSGLGALGDHVLENGGRAMPYGEIPHFPTSSVTGHKGRLVFGEIDGTPVLMMQGRVHRYEGYPAAAVAFPVRVLCALGVDRLVLTNAAGGMGVGMKAGDLMLITDHLNLTGDNPLSGPNDDRLGPRFPDMSTAYDPALSELTRQTAESQNLRLAEGVYAGVLGPSYETPAEIRMLRTQGASAVGMSTVYEAIVGNHAGARVMGISCITNLAAGISKQALSHDEVKETATRVERSFAELVLALVPRLAAA